MIACEPAPGMLRTVTSTVLPALASTKPDAPPERISGRTRRQCSARRHRIHEVDVRVAAVAGVDERDLVLQGLAGLRLAVVVAGHRVAHRLAGHRVGRHGEDRGHRRIGATAAVRVVGQHVGKLPPLTVPWFVTSVTPAGNGTFTVTSKKIEIVLPAGSSGMTTLMPVPSGAPTSRESARSTPAEPPIDGRPFEACSSHGVDRSEPLARGSCERAR